MSFPKIIHQNEGVAHLNVKPTSNFKEPYIHIKALQKWINSMKTETPLSRDAIRDNELLEELETFIHDKK